MCVQPESLKSLLSDVSNELSQDSGDDEMSDDYISVSTMQKHSPVRL